MPAIKKIKTTTSKKMKKINTPRFKVTKKLFRPKFLHLAHHIHENLLHAPLLIGGFYNWHRALSGDFKLHSQTRGTLAEYDILFLGMSKPELEGMMVSRIREEIGYDCKTKIVVCVDYSIEIWNTTFNMHALEMELRKADILFTGEPMMLNHLEVLTNKKVHLIEHPTNVRVLKQIGTPIEKRKNAIVCLIHRYNNDWIPPYLVVKDFKDIDNYAIMLDGNPQNIVTKMPFFQHTQPGVEYENWLDFLKQTKMVLDSYHNMHTYGRNAVDCACLRIPSIGTTIVHAQNILWPQTTTKPNDLHHQKEIVARLKSDLDFYREVTDYAYEKVEFFSYESSRDKFQKLMEENATS